MLGFAQLFADHTALLAELVAIGRLIRDALLLRQHVVIVFDRVLDIFNEGYLLLLRVLRVLEGLRYP